MLRKQRDGVQVFSVHPSRWRGSSVAVGIRGQIRTYCGKYKKSGKQRVGGLPLGGQHDNEYLLCGMMWAGNHWLFCDNQERLVCMVNDIIDELLDLDMGPKPESLWWTSTHKCEDMTTLRVGSGRKAWDLPFREVFEVLGYRYHRNGKGSQGAERTMCNGLVSWWKDKFIFHSKTVLMVTKCKRVLSHVYCTVLNGSINSSWSVAMIDKVRAWEAKILRFTFRPRTRPEETWCGIQK